MRTGRVRRGALIGLITAVVWSAGPAPGAACTRVLYVAKDGTVIAGRSMDWGEDLKSNMWVLPRGMKRDGMGGKDSRVMTNSPTYDKQLAIMEYWQEAGGLEKSLPGTSRAADRFVRATYLLDAIPTEAKPQFISGVAGQKFHFQAMMSVLSVVRSVGTPLGIDIEDQPWVSQFQPLHRRARLQV